MIVLLGGGFVMAASLLTVDPCELVGKAQAAELLGQPVTRVMPSPPEPDEDSGGTRSSCMYFAGGRALIVIHVAFPSPEAARRGTQRALASDDEKPTLREEPGVGDRALWSFTAEGAQYAIVKGAAVVAVSIGGGDLKNLEGYHDRLKAAAVQAVARL